MGAVPLLAEPPPQFTPAEVNELQHPLKDGNWVFLAFLSQWLEKHRKTITWRNVTKVQFGGQLEKRVKKTLQQSSTMDLSRREVRLLWKQDQQWQEDKVIRNCCAGTSVKGNH